MSNQLKRKVQANINALALDPIVRTMALETLKGEATGTYIDFNGQHFMNASTQMYFLRGGQIEPIMIGAVAEAIKQVRNELTEITANQIRKEINGNT
jgi:hypothetical protein